MIKAIKNLFSSKKADKNRKYSGFSDFFQHAPENEKKEVITEAARRANEDQFNVFTKARIKIGTN